MDEKKKRLIEALRALRNAAEDAEDDKIAKRATLDLARVQRETRTPEIAVEAEARTGAK